MTREPASDRAILGIGLGLTAYTLFAFHDAANKWLVGFLPIWQVLFFRSATIVVACLVAGRGRLLERAIVTQHKGPLLLRSVITLAAWLCYYSAAKSMPLAQILTLYFSSPLITALLAIPLLGEKIVPMRWVAMAVAFVGVLLASDPFGVRLTLDTVLVLIAAAFWGYGVILMRQTARHESSLMQMFYQNVCFLLVTGALTFGTWTPPGGFGFAVLLSIGVLGGLGQYALLEAARHAPASVMGTVEYSMLPWAFLLGWLIFGDTPDLAVWLGAGFIMLAGLLLVAGERRRAA